MLQNESDLGNKFLLYYIGGAIDLDRLSIIMPDVYDATELFHSSQESVLNHGRA